MCKCHVSQIISSGATVASALVVAWPSNVGRCLQLLKHGSHTKHESRSILWYSQYTASPTLSFCRIRCAMPAINGNHVSIGTSPNTIWHRRPSPSMAYNTHPSSPINECSPHARGMFTTGVVLVFGRVVCSQEFGV